MADLWGLDRLFAKGGLPAQPKAMRQALNYQGSKPLLCFSQTWNPGAC